MIADIIVDLQYGDSGKGKVAHHLCKKGEYTHVIRYNGGPNAGHTIFHKNKKFITHHIPCGVFFGIKSIIGPGCVVHPDTFLKEVKELEDNGFDTSLIKVASNAHIITDFHLSQDKKDEEIGTTKKGCGPAYRDKYHRKGVLAHQIKELEDYMIDVYQELHMSDSEPVVLFEGAQGFGLDVMWGDYPFVTSSHCTSGSAILNGVPPKSIRDIWGVAKVYETYVGKKDFHGKEDIFDKIRKIGKEFGATTGRPRQVNWLDMDILEMAARINGVNKIVFNKADILEKLKIWKLYDGLKVYEFENSEDMEYWIEDRLGELELDNILFSRSPKSI